MTPPLLGIWLGTRPYTDVYALQCELVTLRREQKLRDVVLLLEHEASITLGRGAHPENLRLTQAALSQRGIAVCPTDRGGDVTLHAPGQLVAYPILDLQGPERDVRRYVSGLREVMRHLLKRHGIDAGKIDEYIGIWADAESVAHWRGEAGALEPVKLGAIGVRISRWVTMHGFALNYTTDMSLFQCIVPCGISNLGVGSVQQLTGQMPSLQEEAPHAHRLIAEQYGRSAGEILYHPETPLDQIIREIEARPGLLTLENHP